MLSDPAGNTGFSIIIPTFNRAQLLKAALDSVQGLRVPAGWGAEVLVVDNNSTDETPQVAEESGRVGPIQVRRIVEREQGLNHGRNRGLAEAAYRVLVYLDDDMEVEPGWLEGYVDVMSAFAPDCVVGPVDPVFEHPPPDWMTSRILESLDSSYSRKGDTAHLVARERAHELPGCNFAVRRDVAMEIGGFHPQLDRSGKGMLAGGDWEFGERLVLHVKKIAYSPRCRIRHHISKHKLSMEGLRDRWFGNGATAGAMMRLRGEKVTPIRWIRLYARMNRFRVRSWRYRIKGDDSMAYRWELEARWLEGMLTGIPPGLSPRAIWTPMPSSGSEVT